MIAIQIRLTRPPVAWNSNQSTKRMTASTSNAWIISIPPGNPALRSLGEPHRIWSGLCLSGKEPGGHRALATECFDGTIAAIGSRHSIQAEGAVLRLHHNPPDKVTMGHGQ